MKHQYIDRKTRQVRTETLKADPVISAVYSPIRENASFLFHLMISARMSSLIGAVSYDLPFFKPPSDSKRFLSAHGIDLSEVAGDPLEKMDQGQWRGMNLTWYGLLSANAYTFAVIMVVILAASAGMPISVLVLLTVLLLAVTIPASKIVARIVEILMWSLQGRPKRWPMRRVWPVKN